MTKQEKEDIIIVLKYSWMDEEKYYQECGGYFKSHIFRVLKRLAKSVGYKDELEFK